MLSPAYYLFAIVFVSACSVEQSGLHAVGDAENRRGDYPSLPIPQMGDYVDPAVGYEALVPVGWRRVVVDEAGDHSFSVTFESPPSNEEDQFSDYLMIEVVPGQAAPGFTQKRDDRTAMVVDGEAVFRERYILNNYPVADTRIDLVAWQINLVRPGYSVVMYAVGESREDSRLERILIEFAHSFSLQRAPFQVS